MDKIPLLIVDDQPEILNTLRRLFQKQYRVLSAPDGPRALEILKKETVAVILSDQRMPGMDGVRFLEKSRDMQPDALRILITGYADIDASIEAVNRAKIYQYVSKPFEPDELMMVVDNAAAHYRMTLENRALQEALTRANQHLEQENRQLKSEIEQQLDLGKFIGHGAAIQKTFKLLRKVVGTPTTVLLLGETGTGKEMLAKMIHFNSPRKDKPFVVQNCGAIPDTLLQSELFGHVKGAFTGAVENKKGLFEQADGGTVFLDEIGDTTPALQLGLLRVLQEGEVKPVGSTRTIKVDVRVIAATNRDLLEAVEEGTFREDLYYRLNVFPIHLPPLRERREDIAELARFFMEKYARRLNKTIKGMTPLFIELLEQAPWPGNVRELENEMERVVTLADEGGMLEPELLSERFHLNKETLTFSENGMTLKEAVGRLEKRMIEQALTKTSGNILKAAEILGVSRVGLHKMLQRHQIKAALFK
ncbi:MAG: sigma-54-dependent Fis family transcriptional regulator [Calditrichaeota bacterium]|nr:MAG: sigma-54-dependent Fis family transcriptional regulator [Calditrichota bacterium]